MKNRIVGAMFLLVAFAILFSPAAGLSQRGSPGGFDPGRIFDQLSKGRGYFMLEDTRMLRDRIGPWLQQQGVSDGKVTRDLFTRFIAESGTGGGFKGPGGPGGFPFKGGPGGFGPGGGPFGPGGFGPGGFGPGGFGPGGGPGRGGNNPSAELSQAELTRFGEMEFRRKDYNNDRVLTPEEMEPRLRESMSSWDKNRDGLVSLEEYQDFFRGKMNERGGPATYNPVTIIIEEEFLDKRPTMFRAGKDVPKEIRWFAELDTDKDGQVSFYEWRKARKDMDEFNEYDRNADGLLTAEEALHYQKKNGATMLASNSSANESSTANGENNNSRSEKNKSPRGDGNGPPRFENFGGNFKKKGDGNGKMKGFGNLSPEERAKKMEEWRAKNGKK